jgi:hypothetical protein
MRIDLIEAGVLITTVGVLLSASVTVGSSLRRARLRRRLSRALELSRRLPSEGYEGLQTLLDLEVRESAVRLEWVEARRIRRRLARSRAALPLILMMSAAFLTALALPASPAARTRPFILSVALAFALIALAVALRRDARARRSSLKRAADSTDPLPQRRPTLLAIWRWFPAGFSNSVGEGEDTITARVTPPAGGADLSWRQEAFPTS